MLRGHIAFYPRPLACSVSGRPAPRQAVTGHGKCSSAKRSFPFLLGPQGDRFHFNFQAIVQSSRRNHCSAWTTAPCPFSINCIELAPILQIVDTDTDLYQL